MSSPVRVLVVIAGAVAAAGVVAAVLTRGRVPAAPAIPSAPAPQPAETPGDEWIHVPVHDGDGSAGDGVEALGGEPEAVRV